MASPRVPEANPPLESRERSYMVKNRCRMGVPWVSHGCLMGVSWESYGRDGIHGKRWRSFGNDARTHTRTHTHTHTRKGQRSGVGVVKPEATLKLCN